MSVYYPQTLPTTIEYPESDGEPVAESEPQLLSLLYAVAALRVYFQNQPDAYAVGNMLFYYEEGNPKAVVAPDVMVVTSGSNKRKRRSYMLWKEKKVPDFVLEITSKTTVSVDQGVKRGVYAYLGVREYFLYDPTSDYLEPPLQGLRLVDAHYLPMPTVEHADGSITVHSNVLGLDLHLNGNDFHFVDPETGEFLRNYEESERDRLEAEFRAQAAEARLAELEARLRELESKT